MPNPHQLSQAIPLERLYVIHSDIENYQEKWTKEKLVDAVFAPGNELTFTTLQYLNRTISVVGASTYLAGEANENTTYKKIGGTVAVASLYVDFLAYYGKEKLFKTGERQKRWDMLNKDTEKLGKIYQELAEILKPIRANCSEKLKEVISSLKRITNELTEKDEQGDLKEVFLLKVWNDDSLSIRRITRWIINLPKILTLRPLTEVSLKSEWWLKEWETRSSKREEFKDLIEILLEAVSEYRQGVANSEIEKKINDNMLKLKSTQFFCKISLLGDIINVPKEVKHAIIDFRERISKLNADKSLSLDISNAKGETLDKEKIEQFIKDLQVIQIGWNDGIKETIDNMWNKLEKFMEEEETARTKNIQQQPKTLVDISQEDSSRTQLLNNQTTEEIELKIQIPPK